MGRSGKTNMKIPGGRHGYRHDQRVADAVERTAQRATRSPAQQIEQLDAILGEGVGAVKERARLNAQISS